ncbi:MAG: IclR family transcriptional regulator [Lachnospiraceae bacterium]|jgi:IclR family KDG regulon transcriptional repressor|nr:IclR family transcriptional regulator [Lachnospiraceae bacterium]MCI7092812.1 IclR family transcriptional regulator [Lachnospiraceae bacterium]
MTITQEHPIHHRTTSRILDILELVAASPNEYTLSDISQKLDVPKSSISPILQELTCRNFLVINETQKYMIGLAAYNVGSSFLQQFHFLDEVERILANMTNVCNEATHFSVLSGGDVLYLKKVNSPEPIRMISYIGNRIPAYATALGKALLLDYTLPQLKRLYSDGLKKVTPNTIDDFDVLYKQIEKARTEGFTYESEESNKFIRCIAVPVRKNGKVVAAMSVATPTFRYDEKKEDLIKVLLADANRKVEDIIANLDINIQDFMA